MPGSTCLLKEVIMKNTALFLALLTATVFVMCKNSNPVLTEKWSTPDKLQVPESVYYDEKRDVLYVSNINGMPTEKNGAGYLSRVSLAGEILTGKWVSGLNAPKGMGLKGETLFVTDIDRLAEVSIPKGKIVKFHAAKGAQFLNDIAIDHSGTVYVSDMAANRIYALKNGSLSVWLELRNYTGVNGMLMCEGDLFTGTDQGLLRIKPGIGDVSLFVPHAGGIDGLRSFGSDRFIVSDWKGKIHLIAPGRPSVLLQNTTDRNINAADMEYIASEKMLLVPTFFNNRVVAYQVE